MIGKKSDLARGCVDDSVNIGAGTELNVGAADPDPLAIGDVLDHVGFVVPVTGHLAHIETDPHAIAQPVDIGGGEIAEDAVADTLALGAHGDLFAHVKRAIGRDGNVAGILGDAFALRQSGRGRGGKQHEGEKRSADGNDADQVNETLGTARSAAFSISK